MEKRRVNIVYRNNGQGLSRDARLLASLLRRAGHAVTLSGLPAALPSNDLRFLPERHLNAWRHAVLTVSRLWRARRGHERWDVNLFLEAIDDRYLPLARKNIFFPNQEWLSADDYALMTSAIDLVLFKSRHAERRLARAATASAYIGFTSEDRRLPGIAPDRRAVLHVAGWNPHKGTDRLTEAWSLHPEWPELLVLAKTGQDGDSRDNLRVLRVRVRDHELRQLQNSRGIHVCPSEVEGFGHSINEARSCGAVVVTTDAPPMNELVHDGANGLLVAYERSLPMGYGTRYLVAREALQAVVERLMCMSLQERAGLGRAARSDYETGRAWFEARFLEVISAL